MQKKVLAGFIALSMCMTFSSSVLAEPDSGSIQEQQSIIDANRAIVDKINQSNAPIQGKIEILGDQIETVKKQISDNQAKVATIQKNIKVADQSIKDSEAKMKEEQDIYNKRMRALYINGHNDKAGGYVNILLNSKSLTDFFSRVSTVKRLSDLDNKITNDLKKQKEDVQKKKDSLVEENNKMNALLNENNQKLAKLQSDKQQQDVLIAAANKEKSKYTSQISAATAEIQRMSASVPKYDSSRGSAPASSNSIVAYAYNFMGKPYVYGGNGPDSFDCSGFTKYVFAHFGVGLNRVAQDQARQGAAVSGSNLQPGDLVFFGSAYNIHHVGIYVGNGCYIHAPHTGANIQVSSMDRSDFYCARRVY